jgi:hypothetical protein
MRQTCSANTASRFRMSSEEKVEVSWRLQRPCAAALAAGRDAVPLAGSIKLTWYSSKVAFGSLAA